MIFYLDLETYCETPIAHGTHRYAEGAEIIVSAWAVDDGPVQVAEGLSPEMVRLIDEADIVVMHNGGAFDRTVLRWAAGVVIPLEKIHDTMVQAQSHGLPGKLEKLCDIFKLGDKSKDKRGKALIQIFCKPHDNWNVRRATKETHPDEWLEFLEYAAMDIVSMRELYRKMPKVNYPANTNQVREHALWCLDQRMNDRGFLVDTELAHAAIETVKKAKAGMDARTQEMTNNELRSTTQRNKLLAHILLEHGVVLADAKSSTLKEIAEDPSTPLGVRELLLMRLQTSTTSNAKYQSLLRSVSSDGRLRGTMLFSGAARTKRWAGRTFQPQNLPRPDMSPLEVDVGILAMKAGACDLLFDEPIKVASNAIRGCIVAPEGRKLVVSDLAQVEARVLPWLAGEQWKLDAFAKFDRGEARDNYVMAYAKGFGVDPSLVDKGQRQIGKVSELSCLGPHTQVLTSNGVKSITEVKLTDYLWDGVQWVAHLGLVSRGRKNVIDLNGLVVTPDHLILDQHHWVEAQTAASNPSILQSASVIALANLPLSDLSTDSAAAYTMQLWNVAAGRLRTQSSPTTSAKVPAPAAIPAPRRQPETTPRCSTNTPPPVQMTSIAVGYSIGWPLAKTDATTLVTKDMLTTALEELKSGGLGSPTSEPFLSTSSPLTGGMIPLSTWIGKTTTEDTNPATSGLCLAQSTKAIAEVFAPSSSELPNWSDVYDIAHAGPNNRFTVLTDDGALIVHNCGYGGSVGAWKAMGLLYGFELPDGQVKSIVDAWRLAHPAICDWTDGFWVVLDRAARDAIRQPGRAFEAGAHIRFERWREWLRMELPSGGYLNYAAPAIIADPRRPGADCVSYMGVNNYTRKWERLTTYGGKLSADATQSTAREIMAAALENIEAAGYPPILLVHDEVVTETPDEDKYSVDTLNQLLSSVPHWAPGLPLAAGGFSAYRYRKDG